MVKRGDVYIFIVKMRTMAVSLISLYIQLS